MLVGGILRSGFEIIPLATIKELRVCLTNAFIGGHSSRFRLAVEVLTLRKC